MRTTLTIDDDVAFRLKKAQDEDPSKPFKVLVNDVLRRGLQPNGATPKRKEFKLITYPMGLRKDLNFDNIEELLDEIEGPNRR